MNIAVICDKDGITASLLEDPDVVVYAKSNHNNEWRVSAVLHTQIDAQEGLGAVRGAITELTNQLRGVKAIVSRNMSGVAYNVFDAAGFAIFEMVGRPERYLDFVAAQLESEKHAKQVVDNYPAHPLPTGQAGRYGIDLIELQKRRPEISSKMALLPFFGNTGFDELLVACAHIPPWFERSLGAMGLKYQVLRAEDGTFKIRIYHAACEL